MTASNTNPEPGGRSGAIPELLTVDEVAEALRLSRSKVYQLIASRQLRAFRPGGRIRISAEAVREFLNGSRL